MSEVVDRDFDLVMLARLRERASDPGIGNEAFTRLSNEIRQIEKKLKDRDVDVPAEVVSVDAACEAFVAELGDIDAELFAEVRQEAIEGRLERGDGRTRSGVGWPAEWWGQYGATPAALMAYRRAARRMGFFTT